MSSSAGLGRKNIPASKGKADLSDRRASPIDSERPGESLTEEDWDSKLVLVPFLTQSKSLAYISLDWNEFPPWTKQPSIDFDSYLNDWWVSGSWFEMNSPASSERTTTIKLVVIILVQKKDRYLTLE